MKGDLGGTLMTFDWPVLEGALLALDNEAPPFMWA